MQKNQIYFVYFFAGEIKENIIYSNKEIGGNMVMLINPT